MNDSWTTVPDGERVSLPNRVTGDYGKEGTIVARSSKSGLVRVRIGDGEDAQFVEMEERKLKRAIRVGDTVTGQVLANRHGRTGVVEAISGSAVTVRNGTERIITSAGHIRSVPDRPKEDQKAQ
ncbi:MAG: hypothetical protein A3C90_02335 [Candidatus Magasanikbacteria bacterium RIFCSPHIGHO2_02_FULL_51_14]|uniref:Uncharacterized protein n=1 Tax=Candidatus Magasanikbacteria bacterium RIFCSPHIGHO2_02_FULL_51_14 TaxID=1798683 RepID=A0A1F6MQ80_9BACT|nr:MAG: hypothetical protein A3C90_02335 [Candidatus Magasanikbacteria bacterium RIFCSPHIGHO2_02_FULL_51_14]